MHVISELIKTHRTLKGNKKCHTHIQQRGGGPLKGLFFTFSTLKDIKASDAALGFLSIGLLIAIKVID